MAEAGRAYGTRSKPASLSPFCGSFDAIGTLSAMQDHRRPLKSDRLSQGHPSVQAGMAIATDAAGASLRPFGRRSWPANTLRPGEKALDGQRHSFLVLDRRSMNADLTLVILAKAGPPGTETGRRWASCRPCRRRWSKQLRPSPRMVDDQLLTAIYRRRRGPIGRGCRASRPAIGGGHARGGITLAFRRRRCSG